MEYLSEFTHSLKRPPDLVTDEAGVSYLLFDCLTCGSEVALRLDSDDRVDGMAIIPPERRTA